MKRPHRPKRRRLPKMRTHDLRHMYGRMPGNRNMVAIAIEEPDGLLSSDHATLETAGHVRGAPEWIPPTRPTIVVAQSIRNDPLGQMYARHQITPVRYYAGRNYQELHEICRIGNVGSSDPMRSPGEGGRFPELVSDRQRAAARKLRFVDRAIIEYLGNIGLFILRCVLLERHTLRQAGERLDADKTTRAFLFNAGLTMTAIRLGLATGSLTDEDILRKKAILKNGKA